MKILKHLTANAIHLDSFPFQRELSMEAYLIENPSVLALEDDEIPEIINDELSIPDGRKSKKSDGRIDLLLKYPSIQTLGVVELKKGEISISNITQLKDYLEHRNFIFEESKKDCKEFKKVNWLGVLVGTSISENLVKHIEENKEVLLDSGEFVPLVALTIRRYKSNDGQIFIATDTYVAEGKKDYTKYEFEGESYPKNRLVLAVMKKYCEDHPQITFEELKKVFPDETQGSFGVFQTVEFAKKYDPPRYFEDSKDVITLKEGKRMVVCSNWAFDTIGDFIDVAKQNGYKIKVDQNR